MPIAKMTAATKHMKPKMILLRVKLNILWRQRVNTECNDQNLNRPISKENLRQYRNEGICYYRKGIGPSTL